VFREQDAEIFKQLAPIAGEEDRYTMAVRGGRETTERVLRAEMARIAAEEDLEDAPGLAAAQAAFGEVERVE
jgi:hypothetical protein